MALTFTSIAPSGHQILHAWRGRRQRWPPADHLGAAALGQNLMQGPKPICATEILRGRTPAMPLPGRAPAMQLHPCCHTDPLQGEHQCAWLIQLVICFAAKCACMRVCVRVCVCPQLRSHAILAKALGNVSPLWPSSDAAAQLATTQVAHRREEKGTAPQEAEDA